jgi:hypothetical protein
MQVRLAAVRVHVQVPAPAGVAAHDRQAEQHEQRRDEQLGAGREGGGDMEAGDDDEQCDHAYRRRVPQPPGEAEARPVAQPAVPGGERRDGGEMVGLESVAQAEQEPEGGSGE